MDVETLEPICLVLTTEKCRRCGNLWEPKIKPKACPKCRSRRWDV